MEIKLGTRKDKKAIFKKYPYTKAVMYNHTKNSYLIVAVENEEILGFMFAFKRKIPAPVEAYEDFINVIEVFSEENRNKGIASKMVQKCIEIARENGSYQVRAYCAVNNIPSHRLWFKNKFSISPVKDSKGITGSFVSYIL